MAYKRKLVVELLDCLVFSQETIELIQKWQRRLSVLT